MKTLGDQAKAFREARGWNTTEMGKAVGTSRQNIESLEEHGNRIPKYIGDLALVMGRSVDDMLVEAKLAKPALLQNRKIASAPWPFKLVDRDQYDLLDDIERGAVQAELGRLIARLLEHRRGAGAAGKVIQTDVEPSQHALRPADDEADRTRYAPGLGGSAPTKYAALQEAARYAEDGNGSTKNQRAPRGKGRGGH